MDPRKTRPPAGTSVVARLLFLAALSLLPATGAAQEHPSLLVTSQLDHMVKEYDGTTGAFIRNAATGIGDPLDAIINEDGSLLVSDGQQDMIMRFDRATGAFLGVFASVRSPMGMTVSGGKVYVCQSNPPQIIRSFDAITGADVGSFVPTVGEGNPYPRDVKAFQGRLYVAYWNLGTVEVFDLATRESLGLLFPPGTGDLATPSSIAFGPDGNLYVSYVTFVNRYHPSTGAFLGRFVDTGDRVGQRYTIGIAWGPDRNLYVATQNAAGVQRYDGVTGAFIDDFVPVGSGGLTAPFHISFTPFTSVSCSVDMAFEFTPRTLSPSSGEWVTGFLEPAAPLSASDIDIASIRLNGTVPVDPAGPSTLGDHNQNGRQDLIVKFDRAAVEGTVEEGDAVTVTITGDLGSGCFEATDVIRVIRGHVLAPVAGSVLQGGGTSEVLWDIPTTQSPSVTVLFSPNDGASWSLVDRALANSGRYLWTVPDAGTHQARIAVVQADSWDQSGDVLESLLGISELFVIEPEIVGVGPTRVDLALHGASPNPSRGLSVHFTLPDAGPATLGVYDVSGREVSARDVGALGAGPHFVSLAAPGRLAPGVYLIRLIHGNRQHTARAIVIR